MSIEGHIPILSLLFSSVGPHKYHNGGQSPNFLLLILLCRLTQYHDRGPSPISQFLFALLRRPTQYHDGGQSPNSLTLVLLCRLTQYHDRGPSPNSQLAILLRWRTNHDDGGPSLNSLLLPTCWSMGVSSPFNPTGCASVAS